MNEVTYKKYLNGERLYKEGKSLSQIGKELHLDRNRLAKFLKERGVHVERMPHKKHINENVFETIDSEEKAYWLGFLYADGSVTNRSDIDISLQLSDERHVEKFYNFIELKSMPYAPLLSPSYERLLNTSCRYVFWGLQV